MEERRKRRWMELAIVVVGLLLVCGAHEGVAQVSEPAGGAEAPLQQEVARLRAEVASLRQQVERLQEQVGEAGVGGAGEAGVEAEGTAEVEALFTGEVKSVSRERLVLVDEEGEEPLALPLAKEVRVVREGASVAVGSLEEGTRVRASADLLSPSTQVTRVEVLESAEGESEPR